MAVVLPCKTILLNECYATFFLRGDRSFLLAYPQIGNNHSQRKSKPRPSKLWVCFSMPHAYPVFLLYVRTFAAALHGQGISILEQRESEKQPVVICWYRRRVVLRDITKSILLPHNSTDNEWEQITCSCSCRHNNQAFPRWQQHEDFNRTRRAMYIWLDCWYR